jgi:ethanolamine utilization protein EutL
MGVLDPLIPTVKATRIIPNVDSALAEAYGFDAKRYASAGLITCDMDDALYAALDQATKNARVDVVFARSFYAGAAHASGATSGEILGILAGQDPEDVRRGLDACVDYLEREAHFFQANDAGTVSFFPHVISSLGHYLSKGAGLAFGEPMAYLIATPLEAIYGLDAALKAADVRLVKNFPPPTETNFAGGFLSGTLEACEAAAQAFAERVVEVAGQPNRA